MSIDPKTIVREGYDRASYAYRGDEFTLARSGYAYWLSRLEPALAPGSRVLDLGCGCGVPATRELARRHQVTGVDISPVQIARARRLVPNARFQCADMAAVEFEQGSFDAAVAFFSLINLPLPEQSVVIERVSGWLVPGGRLLAIVGQEPAMHARLVTRDTDGQLSSRDLFETIVAPLVNAPQPERFVF